MDGRSTTKITKCPQAVSVWVAGSVWCYHQLFFGVGLPAVFLFRMRPVFWHHPRAVGICRACLLPRISGCELDLSVVEQNQANFPEDFQGACHGRSPLSVPMGPRLWFGLLLFGRIGDGSDRVAIEGDQHRIAVGGLSL